MRNRLCRMVKRGQRPHFPSNILESVKNLMITLTFQFFVEYKGSNLVVIWGDDSNFEL